MAQLVIALADALDLGDHVEEAEQRQETGEHQGDRGDDLTRQVATVDFHRNQRPREKIAIRR